MVIKFLYIPHGSDNTKQTDPRGAMNRTIFISHMVQIILYSTVIFTRHGRHGFISHMVQIIQKLKKSHIVTS